MPSKSKKQSRTMTAACKSPKFRSKIGIPKDVACKFHKADKGKYHEEINIHEYSDMMSQEQAKQLLDVAIKKNQPVPQKAIAALKYYRDRNGVNKMSDKQLDEKLRFGKAKEEISTDGSPDIGRLMKMAGIQKKLDDDREDGKLDIRGILTGVANGNIDVSEADVRLQELAGITTKIAEISSKIQQDRLSLIQEIEQQLKQTHLVEDEDEEVDEDKEKVDEDKKEDLDEDSESYLAARDKAIKKAMGKDDDGEDDDDDDSEVDEDKEKVDESHWWTEGSNETERLRQLAGLKAKAFTEAVDEEEVDEGKKRDVDGDGDIDSDDYLAAKDKAIKKAKGEEVDEGKKRDVDGDGDIDSDDYLAAKDKAIKKATKKENVDTSDLPVISEEEIERKYFRKLDTFKEGSLSRYMAEMIVDEMKKGKTTAEISEELSFDIDEVSYIVEFAKKKALEAKQVRGQWGIERASDKEDRLIARLSKKNTGKAQIAKPKPRKRDKYDDLARKHGLEDSARSRIH